MNDDLGRGMLGWPAERWAALDTLAADTVTGSVVMRNLLDHREEPNARTVRIAGKDVPIEPVCYDLTFNMQDEVDADLERGIREAAQQLGVEEDCRVVGAMNLKNPQQSPSLLSAEFIKAKNALRKLGMQQGFGLAISTDALNALETEQQGVRSGLEVVERVVGTTVVQTNGLPCDRNSKSDHGSNIHAVMLQASPAAFLMVHAYGPRIRVTEVEGGTAVKLRLEEGIAVGELTPNRCLGIECVPGNQPPRSPKA